MVWQSTRRHLNNLWYNICQWVLLYMYRSPWNNCKATSRPGMFSLSCKHDKPEKTFVMIYFFYVILALQKGSSVAKFGLQWLRTTSRRVLRPRRNKWRLFNCFYNADLYKALIKRYGVGKLFGGTLIVTKILGCFFLPLVLSQKIYYIQTVLSCLCKFNVYVM